MTDLPPPRTAERLLIETACGEAAGPRQLAEPQLAEPSSVASDTSAERPRIYCTSVGRGQLAAALAGDRPDARTICDFLDLYALRQAEPLLASIENLELRCESDMPAGRFERVALPLPASGDAELTRERLQAGHLALSIGGEMLVATDNPRDQWLLEEMRKLFERVTIAARADGVAYRATKRRELKKRKRYECEFAFRDRERLLRVVSRPGVFSHRHIDVGARALIEAMEVAAGQRVLDLGCGAGVVALAAAVRAERVEVVGLDSSPRAVECTRRGAELNGLTNVRAELNADATVEEAGSFDLVTANPPYFSGHRISEIFLAGAQTALRPGGEALFVTKDAAWYCEQMPEQFDHVEVEHRRGYSVVRGRKR